MIYLKKYLLIIGYIIVLLLLISCGKATVGQKNNLANKANKQDPAVKTYKNDRFKFSVDYPDKLYAEILQDTDIDGGIDIYINKDKNEKITIIAQNGTIAVPGLEDYEETVFETNAKLVCQMYEKLDGQYKDMWLIIDQFHAAHIEISKETFIKNESMILKILASIKIY